MKREQSAYTGQALQFSNPVEFLSTVELSELIERRIETVQPGDTSVSALNKERLVFNNTGAVTVVDIIDGQEGQELCLIGDGFTTIAFNSKLVPNSGGDKLLENGKLYFYMLYNRAWVELNGSNFTAGAGISISSGVISNKYVGKVLNFPYGIGYNNTDTSSLYNVSTSRFVTMVVDLTGMTQYRISGTVAKVGSNGTVYPILSYSTNGSSWTDVNTYADAFSITSTNFSSFLGAWRTLPVGARIASCYIRIDVAQDVSSYINNFAVEIKP